jgi:hypothetical protein
MGLIFHLQFLDRYTDLVAGIRFLLAKSKSSHRKSIFANPKRHKIIFLFEVQGNHPNFIQGGNLYFESQSICRLN